MLYLPHIYSALLPLAQLPILSPPKGESDELECICAPTQPAQLIIPELWEEATLKGVKPQGKMTSIVDKDPCLLLLYKLQLWGGGLMQTSVFPTWQF